MGLTGQAVSHAACLFVLEVRGVTGRVGQTPNMCCAGALLVCAGGGVCMHWC